MKSSKTLLENFNSALRNLLRRGNDRDKEKAKSTSLVLTTTGCGVSSPSKNVNDNATTTLEEEIKVNTAIEEESKPWYQQSMIKRRCINCGDQYYYQKSATLKYCSGECKFSQFILWDQQVSAKTKEKEAIENVRLQKRTITNRAVLKMPVKY
jgi:hypothetical protein